MPAVSASISAHTPRTSGGRPAGTSDPSSRFATTTHGFSVSGPRPRRCRPASSSNPASRSGRSSESAATARSKASISGAPSVPLRPLSRRLAFSSADSITARSARISSARTSARSRRGSGSGPNARRTTQSASASRSAAIPCALVAPGTSTNRTWAGTTFRERSIPASTDRRRSGTGTTAWFARPPAAPARVRAVNSVDLPEYGSPTSPMSFTAPPSFVPWPCPVPHPPPSPPAG